jgi:hypothetical protein
MTAKPTLGERWVMGLAIATGVVLLAIGLRFLLVPDQAARFFGLSQPPGVFDLHLVVALRDLWLAFILVFLALLREWRSLAISLGLGALVCFGDSLIVAASSGNRLAVAFHMVSGIFCAGLALSAWGCSQHVGRR